MVVVLTGPTCAGKTTLAKRLEELAGFKRILTYTTRLPREGEVDGVDYHFISNEEFAESVENNEFLEYTEYNANFGHVSYGSKIDKECFREGRYVIVLNPHGARALRELYPDEVYCIIYLEVPEYTCYQRAMQRGDEAEEVLRRLKEDEIHQFISFREDKIPDYTIWGSPDTIDLYDMVTQKIHEFAILRSLDCPTTI